MNTEKTAILLMAAVAAARGSSFLFSKQLLVVFEPLNLLAVRFLLAFLVLMLVFGRRVVQAVKEEPGNIRAAALIGFIYFAVMVLEMHGLGRTTTGTASLIENSAVVWVPLAEAAIARRFPGKLTLFCSMLSLIGIGFVAAGGFSSGIGVGEILCTIAAFTYTGAIIATDRGAKKYDSFAIGVLYVGFLGAYALIGTFLLEAPHLPASPGQWAMVMMLVLVCSCFGFAMQPVAQGVISSETTGIINTLNPLTAAVLGSLVLHEGFGISKWIGAVLIIGGILLHNTLDARYQSGSLR